MKQSLAISDPNITEGRPNGLSETDFARFRALIYDNTGIIVTQSKRTSIEGKLKKRAFMLGFENTAEYAEMVFGRGGLEAELHYIVNLATTNKTDFFREPAHFDLLEKILVPTLLKARTQSMTPRLKIWSAASSNGAEAFTTAMVLSEMAARGPYFEYAVLGTDVSSEMILEARHAIYPAGMIAPVPEHLKRRYFMYSRNKNTPQKVRVVPELRRNVRFTKVNLVGKTLSVDKDTDVIFLRNVLIYFDPPTQKMVVERLAGHLRPSGYLVLGHTEAAIGNNMGFEQVGTGVFCVK